jgi:hypothetical protein
MAFITETIVGDHRIQLGSEDLVRQMGFGSNWQKIRIGMRLAVYDTIGDLSATSLVIGVCQGVSNAFTSVNCTDFIGGCIPGPFDGAVTWTRTAGAPVSYVIANGYCHAIKKTGAAFPSTGAGTAVQGANPQARYFSAMPGSSHTTVLCDITKGTTYGVVIGTSSTIADVTRAAFLLQMENEATPAVMNSMSLVSYGSSIAYSGAGLFDSVNIRWARSTPTIEISDLTVVRFY